MLVSNQAMHFSKVAWFLALLLASVLSESATDKTVYVTERGENAEACWNGGSCLTLDFALGALQGGANVTIIVNYSHVFDNVTYARLVDCSSVSICGIDNPTISCSDGAGIAFNRSENVTISGLRWVGCSLDTPTTVQGGDLAPIQFISAYTALFFYNVSNLVIEHCYFSSDRGLGVALYDVQGEVRILSSVFSGNKVAEELQCTEMDISNGTFNSSCSPQGGGMYVELTQCGGFRICTSAEAESIVGSSYLIDDCHFEYNDNPPSFTQSPDIVFVPGGGYWPFGIGGGLSIVIRGNSTRNVISIVNSRVTNNSATYGGGINIDTAPYAIGNTFQLRNLVVSANKANSEAGGGFRAALISAGFSLQNNLTVVNVTFEGNSADSRGGGVIIVLGRRIIVPSTFGGIEITIPISVINSTFTGNTAFQAGAAIMVLQVNLNFAFTLTGVRFSSCTFDRNYVPTPSGQTVRFGQGAIFTLGVPLYFEGDTVITGNTGSALAVAATEVNFAENVLFQDNAGLLGGGLYLTEVAYMVLHKGLNLTFHHNSAFEAGGAIHYVYPTPIAFDLSGTCFVTYEHERPPPSEWDVTVTFSENRAVVAGSAIFVSDPPGCTWPNGESLFDPDETQPFNFTGTQLYSAALGTPVHNITFIPPYNKTGSFYTQEVMPGQELDIPVNITDYFGTLAVSSLDTKCVNFTLALQNQFFDDVCAEDGEVIFNGPRVLTVSDSITGFSLGGEENTNVLIFYKTFGADPIILTTLIVFSECKYGFIYDEHSKSCNCNNDQNAIRCFTINGTETPCIRTGYWYGTLNSSDGEILAEVACPFDNCNPACKEQCLSNLHGWCRLPSEEYELCEDNHGGPLCALCRDGYSFNYNGLYCLSDDACNPGITALLIFLMLVFWVVLVVALLVVLRLNLRIGSGYVYCFVYYFSVLPYLTDNFILHPYFNFFIAIFLSIAKLDPQFLSYSKLCFIEGITPVQMEIFHYFHPLMVALLIYLLILASRHCSRFSFLSRCSPIHAICILLLLSYASLLQTSLSLIAPLRYFHTKPATKDVFVRIQPDTEYFHPTKHLPYALIAFAIEICLVFPFAVIVILAPWLMRWRQMTRFKPILDEYQACYKDRYRWFAGYYLVCRHVVALTTFIFVDQAIGTFFLQIVNVTILFIHAYFQPYKERWLNVLDAILLADLTLLSLLKAFTAQTIFSSDDYHGFRVALRYILVLIPCLYFILACAVVFFVKIRAWYSSKKNMQKSVELEHATSSDSTASQHSRDDYDTINDDTVEKVQQKDARSSPKPIAGEIDDEDHPLLGDSAELTIQVTSRPLSQSSNHSTPPRTPTSSQLRFVRRTRETPSRKPSFLNRVVDGVSSGVQYWRSTAHQSVENIPEDSLALVERHEPT